MTARRPVRQLSPLAVASTALLLAAAAALVSIAAGVPRPASATTRPGSVRDVSAVGGSAVTKSGRGPFKNLTVTVSQTQALTNQVITVTWTGGGPTDPVQGSFSDNYLQIMQCWGSDPTGPTSVDQPNQTQCEFGGIAQESPINGDWTASRQLNYDFGIVDPNQHQWMQPPGSPFDSYVPFDSVEGTVETGDSSQWYDGYTTNEVDYARTYGNGTGIAYFNALPAPEAPGLGCGAQLRDSAGQTYGRPCWLVVVPRGTLEVTGKPSPTGVLESSPLSQTNWDERIVFPLDFQPVGTSCSAARQEVQIVGDEMPEDALTSWQSAVCKEADSGLTFSEVSDEDARTQLESSSPGLDLVGAGAPPSAFPKGVEPVYAPIAVNAVGIAFNIDWQAAYGQPKSVQQYDGLRINSLKLTALLVAKLLTQSYQAGADLGDPAVAKNPLDLSSDPEFLALNPEFKKLRMLNLIPDILTPIGNDDAITELWEWVLGNAAARRWLDGAPDPNSNGMTVNPYFKGITSPPSYFPKDDPYCVAVPTEKPLCLLDLHPYSNDMHDGARAISRGSNEATAAWNVFSIPPDWSASPAEPSGAISLMAFTDLSTADRYDLPMAALENSAGNFVTPTSASISAAFGAMTDDPTTGLLEPDPTTTVPDAYPLTTITYAATVPSLLSTTERAAYSALLTYAAGPGQVSGVDLGQLPPGYLPLPAALAADTLADAKLVASGGQTGPTGGKHHKGKHHKSKSHTGTGTSPPPTTIPPSGTTGPSNPGGSHHGGTSKRSHYSTPPAKKTSPTTAKSPPAAVSFTPPATVGPLRLVPLFVLIVGGVAGLSGFALLGRRKRRTHKPRTSPAPS